MTTNNNPAPLAVGDVIHGFANGAFGRDSYDCRTIEAVGPDWIVTRNTRGETEHASGRRTLELCQDNREQQWDGSSTYAGERLLCCTLPGTTPPLTTWSPS